MRKVIVIILLCAAVLLGFRSSNDILRVPENWPKPVYDFNRYPLKQEKIDLGRRLFYETLLSRDSSISCNSCHLSYTAFTHIDHKLSHGIQGLIGTRNAPALMNLAWSNSFMWDGRIDDLNEMSKAPICNSVEMDANMNLVVSRLNSVSDYRMLFQNAFGDSIVTSANITQALAQFMLTFVSASAKYDRVMAGVDTFTARETHGYHVFQQHCSSCHTEPLFTNNAYENNGLVPDSFLNDSGRMKLTRNPADYMKFKVPSLRNVEVTYPYMHDGRYRNLQMVLFHYSEEIVPSPELSPKLASRLALSEQEKSDVVLFLKTLTDTAFIRNKNFQQPDLKLLN